MEVKPFTASKYGYKWLNYTWPVKRRRRLLLPIERKPRVSKFGLVIEVVTKSIIRYLEAMAYTTLILRQIHADKDGMKSYILLFCSNTECQI